MNTADIINHIDQIISTAHSEEAKATINHLLDFRNLVEPVKSQPKSK